MFFKLIQERRSIRKFKSKPVEKEKIDLIVQSALLSPSSRGIDPWEFIVVTDKDIIVKLSKAKANGSEFLKNAPLAIIVCVDSSKSDVWIEDTSIASIIICLIAEELELGACWIQIRNRMHDDKITSEAFVIDTLNICKDKKVESIIAIGYPDEKKIPSNLDELEYNKVSINRYGNIYKIKV